jgi:Ca2+-transporting ATPase
MEKVVWHALDPKEAVEKLGSNTAKGLTTEEAKKRLAKYGPNALQEEGGAKVWELILNQFKDAFVIMLLVASVFSLIVEIPPWGEGEYGDAILIAIIVILSTVVGFIQEYRSEKALEAMRKLTSPTARVLRGGHEAVIPAQEIVPGDIVVLEEGDRAPADARLLEIASLKTDEAPLTGESTPIDKVVGPLPEKTVVGDRKNSVFMGTHLVYGHGKAVVTATGMSTEFGKIAGAVQAIEEEKTPLNMKLDHLAKRLGIVVITLCVIIFGIEFYELDWRALHTIDINVVLEAFMSAVALAVSAVPEALPALVTVTLAIGARTLAKNNALVRKLASAETLGSTTVICADKTGTLTKGEMTVRRIYVNGRMAEVSGAGYEAVGDFYAGGAPYDPREDEHMRLLLRIGALSNNAHYDGDKILGDPTEGALIVAAAKAGMTLSDLREEHPRVNEIPFSSERKRMTTIHTPTNPGLVAYVKGAPEIVLARCTQVFENGHTQELTEAKRQEILRINEQMAADALRVLGLAYRELPDDMQNFTEDTVEQDLTFVGLQGMIDPPRQEVIDALKLTKRAGITNVMITGDHKLTAAAIAKEIGMIDKVTGEIVMTGAQLDELSDEEFTKVVDKVRVYARVSPMHKLKIVEGWKAKGEIVAMTGDGVNDAPALKRADIGVAMGISGTDVSKEASDMVLADDNYATLVHAVEGGRAIFDNLRKYIRFLIACNFDELLVIGGWTLLGFPLPMLPIQILWINLVTDGAPAIALSVDPAEEGIMDRAPRNPRAGIFDGMLGFIILSFMFQSLGSSLCFAYGMFLDHNYEKAVTMTFLQAALFELFVIWNCRSETHSFWRLGRRNFDNLFFVLGTIGSMLLTVGLMAFEATRDWFNLVPLSWQEWLMVLGTASTGLWLILPEWFSVFWPWLKRTLGKRAEAKA